VPTNHNSRTSSRSKPSGYGAAVDVNWWVIVVPSVITGAVTAVGVTWSNMVAQRNNRRDAELREFHMMIGMVLSADPETRRLGENMLRSAVDNPGKRDKEVQRKIVAFWIDRLNPVNLSLSASRQWPAP
jgi:hypothetical protein